MNRIYYLKEHIQKAQINDVFCSGRCVEGKENKCTKFISNSKIFGKCNCPYGFSCAKGRNMLYCGFLSADQNNLKTIKKRAKFYKTKIPKTISDKEYDLLYEITKASDYCSICSQTAHDLIHFSGQLKTLIDESLKVSKNDDIVTNIIKEYRKYISSIETYQKSNRSIMSGRTEVDINDLEKELDFWCKKQAAYNDLLVKIKDISGRIEKILCGVTIDERYKGQYVIMSLLSMQGLFDYRIKYHEITLSELMDTIETSDLPCYKYNWHRISKKLCNILYYQAKVKGAHFSFSGNLHELFCSRENIYLALYIVLENSVKYCKPDIMDAITLSFKEENNRCVLEVVNGSDYISKEKIPHLIERGVSGDNSSSQNSNGIGLYVVKKICDENNIEFSIDYKDNFFKVILSANKITL